MTIQRIIELLEIEHECILRNSHDDCDRNCADCDLVQDDEELHEMYTDAIALLKEQEPKTGVWILDDEDANSWECSECGSLQQIIDGTPYENGWSFCPHCGTKLEEQKVKLE